MRLKRWLAHLALIATLGAPVGDSLEGNRFAHAADSGLVAVVTTQEPTIEQRGVLNANVPLQNVVDAYKLDHPQARGHKKIVIEKSINLMTLYMDDVPLKEYDFSRSTRDGDKNKEGDKKTPEGVFYVAGKNPNSKYAKALVFSYPNKEDAARGIKAGLISKNQKRQIDRAIDNCKIPSQKTDLGSFLEIHGDGGGWDWTNWTHGCVAVPNADMNEIYKFGESGCQASYPGLAQQFVFGKRGQYTPRTIIEVRP